MSTLRLLILILMLLTPRAWSASGDAQTELESALGKLDTGIALLEQRSPDAKGVIREATADLRRVIQEHRISTPGAYHALGNAHSLLGEHGQAVLAYKRGERIDPTNPRLQDSLKRARAQIQIRVEPDAKHRAVRMLMSWRGIVPRSLLWGGFIVLFSAAWLLMAAKVAFQAPRWFVTLGFWSMGAAAIPFTALGAEWMLYLNSHEVVITQDGTTARSGPDDGIYEPVYTEPLSAGVEGTLIEQRDNWAQLKLADGTRCWVPLETFEFVFIPDS